MIPPVVDAPFFLLDYDGTLAEVVGDPDRAFPHPEAPSTLAALARAHPLRIITGRRVADLTKLLDVPGLPVVGIHGMEEGSVGGEVRPRLVEAAHAELAGLRDRLPVLEGVRVEDKGSAIALHYRGAVDEGSVLPALRTWAEGLPGGLEAIWGKKVVEVRPRGHSKGTAARELAAAMPQRTPVVIGDDTTDEDAFRALPDGVTIKVGPGETDASYRLADVDEVIDYLKRYL